MNWTCNFKAFYKKVSNLSDTIRGLSSARRGKIDAFLHWLNLNWKTEKNILIFWIGEKVKKA